MDPLVKAHMRIAALEQQLRESADPRGSFTAHAMRVIPLPGDRILCALMDKPMDVVQVNVYLKGRTLVTPERHQGFVVSENSDDPDDPNEWVQQHTCRPKTCMNTIRIQRRGREDFETALLKAEFRDEDSYSYGSTG